jgi:hypothetical protein
MENSSDVYRWVLTTTNYFTRWVEAIPMKRETEEFIVIFLKDRIITRFGSLAKITIENANDFSSLALAEFCFKYGIVMSHSFNYYP